MKKMIRLTESDLHRIVKQSVKRVLKEGHTDGIWYERWEKLAEMLGPDNFLMELWNCLDSNEIEENICWIARNNDLEEELGL